LNKVSSVSIHLISIRSLRQRDPILRQNVLLRVLVVIPHCLHDAFNIGRLYSGIQREEKIPGRSAAKDPTKTGIDLARQPHPRALLRA
jgi:hypothetical protein